MVTADHYKYHHLIDYIRVSIARPL